LRCLLDTHTLIWWMLKDERLSKLAHSLIQKRENTSFVSAASAWEIATKVRLGRLPMATALVHDFAAEMDREGIEVLAITAEHGVRAGLLLGPHQDPFDRMLIAQALTENIQIVSNDRAFDGYGITRLW
jgi:PIN domain nuclease of toxin-antitoxin system